MTPRPPDQLPAQALDDAEYNARAFAHPAPPRAGAKAGHPRAGRAQLAEKYRSSYLCRWSD